MKQSKIRKAEGKESGQDKKPGDETIKTVKNNKKDANDQTPPIDTSKEKGETAKKETGATPKPDVLAQFQALEWHALTLAGAQMDEASKKERLTAMLSRLGELGTELKLISRKSFGLSPESIDMRVDLAGDLVQKILKSGQRFPMNKDAIKNSAEAQAAMSSYEASEWKMLEQGLKAKDAAQSQNAKRRETEQANLFKSAEQYFGATCGLASESEKLGIPKEIVQMRTEQRLNHMGNDPQLKDMRNPSPDAYVLTGSAAFITYVKQLVEKLAKAIKEMVAAAKSRTEENAEASPVAEQASARPN
jgi:hypothetical protein